MKVARGVSLFVGCEGRFFGLSKSAGGEIVAVAVAVGIIYAIRDMLQVTGDTQHVTHDTSHLPLLSRFSL